MARGTIALAFVLGAAGACDPSTGGEVGAYPVDSQRPPTTGKSDIEAWLAQGHYKSWHCEPAPHPSRRGSPHGTNRICSNDLLSAHDGPGPGWPVDAAGVKEFFDASGAPIGYAMYRHVTAGSGGGDWYWYERIEGVVADGLGTEGKALDSCVGCHQSAGQNGQTGHDLVFTQVK